MMHAAIIASQANALREWAASWEQDAGEVSGAGEVAMLLRRAAKQAEGCIGTGPPGRPAEFTDAPEAHESDDEPVPHETEAELRHG